MTANRSWSARDHYRMEPARQHPQPVVPRPAGAVIPRERSCQEVRVYFLSSSSPLGLELKLSKRHLSPRVLRGSASGALFFYDTDGAVLLTPTGTTALPFPTAATPSGPRRGEYPVWFIGDDNILPMSDGRIVFLRVQRVEQQVATLQEGGIEKQIARLPDDWGPFRVADAAITRDGGRTWSRLGVPSAAMTSASRAAIPDVGMGGVRVGASDVGLVLGRMARLGWADKDDTAIGEEPQIPTP